MQFQCFFRVIHKSIASTAILSLVGLCSACGHQDAAAEKPVVAAPVTAVVALGRIEPEGEVIKVSVPNAQDSRVNQMLVKEGDFVKANQVIAILQGLDRRQAELQDAEVDVRLRQAELAKAQRGDAKKAQLASQRAAIIQLEAQLQTQTMQRKAAIASAVATLRNAQLTYTRREALAKEGAINQADLNVAQRDLATAQATLAERQAEFAQTVTVLPAEIDRERAKLAELQEVRPVDVEIARAQLDKAKIEIVQQKANLQDALVRAPVAGRILKINTRTGEQVNTAQGIVELARTDHMFAVAEVSETDITKVRLRQRATISTEYGGFAGEIHGTVEQIGLQIGKKALQDTASSNSPTTDRDARVVAVKVQIDKQDNSKVAALTNMQVRVKLEIAETQPHKASSSVDLPVIDYNQVASANYP